MVNRLFSSTVMGEMSSDETPTPFKAYELPNGWSFKQTDDKNCEWLPVKKIPSTVHQDLIDNDRYLRII